LAEERERRLAKVCIVLLEVRAGGSPRNSPGEVQELQLHGAGHDYPLVLAGEVVRVVDEVLDFVADHLSPAGTCKRPLSFHILHFSP
jgi:hypothetical protein